MTGCRPASHATPLHCAGFEVKAARNGNEAIRRIENAAFDVFVSDVTMPGMNGIHLLEAVRAIDEEIQVILITCCPQIDSAVKAVEHGALRYLTKPVSIPRLVEVVEYAVRIHQLAKIKREALLLLEAQSQRISDRTALEASFKHALSSLWIAFQPIVSMSQKRILAYEALVRSHEPTLPNPPALLEAAEALGMVHKLGRRVRERVASTLIRHIHLEPTKARLVRSLLGLCEEMGISAILEGVETTSERNYLGTIGADLLQGFALSKPREGFTNNAEISW